MTQHIEPVCWTSEDQIQKAQADPGHNMLIWGEPLVHHPDVALVRLSDAQAALAAAEERGRIEERERCANIANAIAEGRRIQQVDAILSNSKKEARDFESMKFCAIEISAAITKEPTP